MIECTIKAIAPEPYPYCFVLVNLHKNLYMNSHQLSLVTQSCPTRTPGFPVHHQLAELAQTHVHLVKAMVFPVVMYGYESWTIKKAEHQRINAELW